ncbi:MAG: YkgJ family cysteine cluster protein [Pseudomonadota bacterium]|jgi:Fe-S-cluster containining protein
MGKLTGPLLETGGGRYACRSGCGACCIALSISSPIPGMPEGKPAGVRCAQLTTDNRCAVFGDPARPAVCASLRPEPAMCGASAAEALANIAALEAATAPPFTRGGAG